MHVSLFVSFPQIYSLNQVIFRLIILNLLLVIANILINSKLGLHIAIFASNFLKLIAIVGVFPNNQKQQNESLTKHGTARNQRWSWNVWSHHNMLHWLIRVVFFLDKGEYQIVDAVVEHIERIYEVANRIANLDTSLLSNNSEDNSKSKRK